MDKKTWDNVGTYAVTIVCVAVMMGIGIEAFYWQNQATNLTFERQCDRIYGVDNWTTVKVGAIWGTNDTYSSPLCSCDFGADCGYCENTACMVKP